MRARGVHTVTTVETNAREHVAGTCSVAAWWETPVMEARTSPSPGKLIRRRTTE